MKNKKSTEFIENGGFFRRLKEDKPGKSFTVMLNSFQHLVCMLNHIETLFLPLADAPFIPVHRTGFLGAVLIKNPPNSLKAVDSLGG
jgi:hypothetical protein